MLNANEIKQQVSLVDLLNRMGYQPCKKSGKELIYLSMLRDSDSSPSFCVNEELGVWFDHGMGKGGNIIDFGLKYWWPLSLREVLIKISSLCQMDVAGLATLRPERSTRPRLAIKLPNYQIEHIKDLGNNPAITSYLKSRGIWNVASNHLKEIYYFVEDEKKLRKQFFAAGWQNENGGWEVRNKYFKGCLGRKGMTFIAGNQKLAVFEGYLNYLSWKLEHREDADSILVLNSLSFLPAGIDRSNKFSEVTTFFDLDKSGIEATKTFKDARPQVIDGSFRYTGYNDYNEKLQAELNSLLRLEEPREGYMTKLKIGFSR